MATERRLANLLGATALAGADRMRAAVEGALGSGGAAPAALVHLAVYPGESAEALHRTASGHRTLDELLERRAETLSALLAPLSDDERVEITQLLEKVVAGLAAARPEALTTCRLCDYEACRREPGCPLGHAIRSSR